MKAKRNYKKPDYKRLYLEDFKRLSGIADLTLQDVYGALIHLTDRHQVAYAGRSLWSKSQFERLYRDMLETDNPYRNTTEDFKNAVAETRYRRTHKAEFKPEPIAFSVIDNPEENMERVSEELLRKDGVLF